MNSEKPNAQIKEIMLPSHSVDWRFLLPINREAKILVICAESNDYDRSFRELEIPVMVTSLEKLGEGDGLDLSKREPAFDVVAAPLGLTRNRRGGRSALEADLRAVSDLVRSGGVFLLGFSGHWALRRTGRKSPGLLTARELSRLLSELGFETPRFYGAIPEPLLPEYIFPLSKQTLSFTLNHRYQQKLPRYALKIMKGPAVNILQYFLPFYYLIAGMRK